MPLWCPHSSIPNSPCKKEKFPHANDHIIAYLIVFSGELSCGGVDLVASCKGVGSEAMVIFTSPWFGWNDLYLNQEEGEVFHLQNVGSLSGRFPEAIHELNCLSICNGL